MQEGSIVVMDKPMEETLWIAMAKLVGIDPPRPSGEYHMVTAMASEKECEDLNFKKGAIYIDSYPKYEKVGVPFDITLFSELLPPSIRPLELVESHELELA